MNEIKKSFCIDYFKFRVDGLIDIPKSQEEYINDSNGNIECDFSFINELCKILLIKPYQHYDNDPGWQGYKFFSIFDEDIAIFGGRKSEEAEDNNIPRCFVELKGHALRMFELRCIDNGIDVFDQYKKLFDFCMKHTLGTSRRLEMKRIDCTCDDYSNLITIKELQDKLRNGFYTTSCRALKQSLNYGGVKTEEDKQEDMINEIITKGWTAYVGGRTSRQLCIYDKKAERETAGNEVLVDTWLRYEARFYSQNATIAFMNLYKNVFENSNKENFNKTIGALINQIIQFKEDNNAQKISQCHVLDWSKWTELLDPTDIDFNVQASKEKDISFTKKKIWLIKSPFMNLTLEFLCDIDFEYKDNSINFLVDPLYKIYEKHQEEFNDRFTKFIYGLLKKGKKKLDNQKLAIVNNLRKSKGLCYIRTLVDAQNIIDAYIGCYDELGITLSEEELEEEDESL